MPSTSSRADNGAPAPSRVSERDARRNRIDRLDRLANVLDARFRIPGLGIPVGWDSILGLIPGVGDVATALPGMVMFYEARRMGARKRASLKIAANTGIDLAIGTIPIVGDAFDVFFKSHRRNIAILKDELSRIEAKDSPHGTEDTSHSDTDQKSSPKTVKGLSDSKVLLGSREGMAARSSATSPAKMNATARRGVRRDQRA